MPRFSFIKTTAVEARAAQRVFIMDNNTWRGFTPKEQDLYQEIEERDCQLEDTLSGTFQLGYEILHERMDSSLVSICQLLKEGKTEDARKLYETIFSYYGDDAELKTNVEFLKRALPLVAKIRARKDALAQISEIIQKDIADLETILYGRYRIFKTKG